MSQMSKSRFYRQPSINPAINNCYLDSQEVSDLISLVIDNHVNNYLKDFLAFVKRRTIRVVKI